MLDVLFRKSRVGTDRSRAIFILIALAGVLPSALVLWFASQAIRNERVATERVAEEAHRVLQNQIKADLIRGWSARLEEIDRRILSLPPAMAFYETVTVGDANGLIIFTDKDAQRIIYPFAATESPPALGQGKDPDAQLASNFTKLSTAIQRNDSDQADQVARTILSNAGFESCIDETGRHTLSSIELFILENRKAVTDATSGSVLERLTKRLNNYRSTSIPASQRRFLMSRVSELTPSAASSAPVFPTMTAEFLSAQAVEANDQHSAGPNLSRSTIDGVWVQRLLAGGGVAIFTEERIRQLLGEGLASMVNPLASKAKVEFVTDSLRHLSGTEVLLGADFPGWRLRIVEAEAAKDSSLTGMYVALSVASVALILFILFVITSIMLRRLALAQQKNTMVATVSHELKTPVSSIKLLVDTLLQDKALRPDRVREYLSLISRENLRLTQLIENVLSFSRIERTKFKIEKERIDIADVIREAAATFSQQHEILDGELILEIASDLPPYRGDAWALNRVMLNLLDNAYKFSDPPRQIKVAAKLQESHLLVAVSDKGIGINEADQKRIFDQFYQADQRLSRSNEGCGLGLSIVKHIVTLHAGTIDVESKAGAGSAFTIRLPLEQQD